MVTPKRPENPQIAYANVLTKLTEVRELPREVLRGTPVRVFTGKYLDRNWGTQNVTVWIGAEDNLLRRIAARWGPYRMAEEYYDYNAPFSILPPS